MIDAPITALAPWFGAMIRNTDTRHGGGIKATEVLLVNDANRGAT